MNKIIAPVDFSDVSINAVQYAAQLAAALNKTLIITHVVQLPVVYGDVPMPVGEYESLVAEAKEKMDDLVKALEQTTQGQAIIHTEVKVGSPVYELVHSCKPDQVYCIVMGTHGAGSVERFFLGSTTQSVITESKCPVLVIPQNFAFRKVFKVGFASDFKQVVKSTPAKKILEVIRQWNADLEILHVDPDYAEFEPSVMEEGLLLETMFEEIKPKFQFLHSGYIEESILNYAADNELDMLIVTPKSHSFLESLFMHQHTGDFVRQATVPVLILKND